MSSKVRGGKRFLRLPDKVVQGSERNILHMSFV